MLSKRGVILSSSIVLVSLFSALICINIQNVIFLDQKMELLNYAKSIEKSSAEDSNPTLSVERVDRATEETVFERIEVDGRETLQLLYKNIKITKDITYKSQIFTSIRVLVLLFAIGIIVLIFIYETTLRRDIEKPIELFNRYLENVNEKSITEIQKDKLPESFHLLADTINDLLNRLDTFILYQKELFIGASHELKTPLAVIKAKNQVLLLKNRSSEEYIEAIRETNKQIDGMNKIVSDVLNIGRQESAQFEPPVEADIVSMVGKLGRDFKVLAESQGKIFSIEMRPDSYSAPIQPTLLHQIIQNFLQNAIKFTERGGKITLQSQETDSGTLLIEIVDEGFGVDEKEDYFAPFKRTGNKSGVGLGLFLAKSAADSMSANISIKNRRDGVRGAVATLEIKNRLICKI